MWLQSFFLQCSAPDYVGDGVRCTPDVDGDLYPAVPLDNCDNTTNATFCIAVSLTKTHSIPVLSYLVVE